MTDDPRSITAVALDERVELSLSEVCRTCGLEEALVLEMVAEGIVEPLGHGPDSWRFSGIAVTRVLRVVRLQRDFEVNLPGAALALELIEELERLRRLAR